MKILIGIVSFNEGDKIKTTIARHPRNRNYDILICDDCSTDLSIPATLKGIVVLRHSRNLGVGAAIKTIFKYALKRKYDILVIQAGNNKDDARDIPKLVQPLLGRKADFVQGSRFLPGASYKYTPQYRVLLTKFVHPILFRLATEKSVTESTNGFRAFKTKILLDKRINWHQKWLDKYELEVYLLYKVIKLGYRHIEVPVTKIYPHRKLGYTKMKPVTGWWSILRPIFYLWWGIKN